MNNLIVIASLTSILSGLFGPSWESVDDAIATEFPSVKSVSTASLHQRLRNPTVAPVVVDVRASKEFEVSYLPTAVNLATAGDIAQRFPDRNTELVLYCSVGYRSAAVVDELMGMGYRRVVNLRHSLFEWANQDYPLINAGGATPYAHPYNRRWGRLLRSELRRTSLSDQGTL